MADANVPTLRIRCPKCRTVMRVPIGAKPTCATCNYAGKTDAAAPGPAFPLDARAPAVQWDAAPEAPVAAGTDAGAWEPGQQLGEATWNAAPQAEWPEAPTEPQWQPVAEGEAQWQEAPAEAWPEPEASEPAAKPAKKARFFRAK